LLNWKWIELLWHWPELLIIPIVIGAGTFWFNTQSRKREIEQELARRESEQKLALQARESEQELAQRERENDREIAQDRAREEALQRYLDRMQELILDKGLRRSEKGAEIRDVARARTLAVLRSLDGDRKGQVVRFLHEADLIGKVEEQSGEREVVGAIIDLQTADLIGADLRGANLTSADLRDADLTLADLRDAKNWTNRRLAQAESLFGATLPDGTVIPEEGA
jgi:pentapeptide repeat protein